MSQAGHKWLAAITSVLLHLLVLSFLALTGFTHDEKPVINKDQQQLKIEHVENLINDPPLVNKSVLHNFIPKPPLPEPLKLEKNSEYLLTKTVNQRQTNDSSVVKINQNNYEVPFSDHGISFFTSNTISRKICFLVDRSGSMKGLWGTIKTELIRSIDSLMADQYFSVVFFGDNGILELSDSKLLRASTKNKEKAKALVNSTEPSGQTNALAGFDRALKITSEHSAGPDVIFFLTDGFELAEKNVRDFELSLIDLVQKNLPKVEINSIGFWPSVNDLKLLKSVANLTGGDFVIINDSNFNER